MDLLLSFAGPEVVGLQCLVVYAGEAGTAGFAWEIRIAVLLLDFAGQRVCGFVGGDERPLFPCCNSDELAVTDVAMG